MGLLDGMFGGLSSPFDDHGSQFIRGLLAQGINPMALQPFAQQPQGQPMNLGAPQGQSPFGALAAIDGQPPMPPPRPKGLLGASSEDDDEEDTPAPKAQTVQGAGTPPSATPMAGQSAQASGNPLQSIGDLIGGIYGKGGPGDGLIALGAGLMSKRRIGEGLSAGLDNMQRQQLIQGQTALQHQKLTQQQSALQGRMAYLKQLNPNMTPEALAATASNDTLFNEVVKRATPSEQYTQETDKDGNVWSINKMTGQRTLALKAEKDPNAQLVTVNGQQIWMKPGDATGTPVGPATTPGAVDQDTLAKERAKAQVKQETDATQKSVVAQTIMPHIDRAIAAYTELNKNNAIGPTQASGIWRGAQGVAGAKNEVLRQEYEAAAKELELAKAAISMKGQGAITDSERRILALTLPRLDAADGSVGLKTLQNWKMQHSKYLAAAPSAAGNNPNAGGPAVADPLGIR